MYKEKNEFLRKTSMASDVFMISCAFFISFIIKHENLNPNKYLAVYFVLVILWYLMLYLNGMYRSMTIRIVPETLWIVIKSAFWVTVAFSIIVFFIKLLFISRLFFVLFMAVSCVLVLAERSVLSVVISRFLKKAYNRIRLLIFGTGERALHVIETIESHPEWGYELVKTVDYAQCPIDGRGHIKDCEVLETGEDMRRILRDELIDQVIFVVPRNRLDTVEGYLYICNELGVDAAVAADFFNIREAKLRPTDLDGIPLITLEKRFDKEWQLFVKRTLDIIISGLGIILLSPLFLIAAILIKITSPGPVFFLQERVSLHGRKFTMVKFRSMHKEAENELKKLRSLNEVEGPIFKIKDDPRITPFGHFLRKFSVDELPQLFNVFLGRMSLVGPRPALPDEVEQYTSMERRRISVRPGITCLWQAYHRGEKSFKNWMQSDLDYVDQWSLGLDFKIFTKTILVVLSARGAY